MSKFNMNDKACRKLATEISKSLFEYQKHGSKLTKIFMWFIIYQELKRSKLNITKT